MGDIKGPNSVVANSSRVPRGYGDPGGDSVVPTGMGAIDPSLVPSADLFSFATDSAHYRQAERIATILMNPSASSLQTGADFRFVESDGTQVFGVEAIVRSLSFLKPHPLPVDRQIIINTAAKVFREGQAGLATSGRLAVPFSIKGSDARFVAYWFGQGSGFVIWELPSVDVGVVRLTHSGPVNEMVLVFGDVPHPLTPEGRRQYARMTPPPAADAPEPKKSRPKLSLAARLQARATAELTRIARR